MIAETPKQAPEVAESRPGQRVLIDALAARFGGTAYAAVALARGLAARPGVASVAVVTRRGSIVAHGLCAEDSVTVYSLPAASRLELLRRLGWEWMRLPALARRERSDAVISMSGMLPRSPGCRLICLLFNPVMYERRGLTNALRRWAVRRSARRAHYLAAPSRYMADLVAASCGYECAVVPLGVDHSVFTPASATGKDILCVADFYAHKRHHVLIDAWLALASPRPRLRLVGNPDVDPENYASVVARIASLHEASSISLEHRITRGALVDAYHGARVFAIASELESFCMPLVESMACGVPALAADSPSLRETGGTGARYLDDDPRNWAAALRVLIEDDLEHKRAREAAIQAAARFSWERQAAELAERL